MKNYFEFYDIPVSFELDQAVLKRIFYANSKKYHPDFYTLESEEKQAEVLELSTRNNEAYKTLSDFDKRMRYILDLKNAMGEEGQNKLPQSFLMEMMDINEVLMELEFDFDAAAFEKVNTEIVAFETRLHETVQPVLTEFTTNTALDLAPVKEFYLKKRYLLRIKENLNKFASA